MRILLYSGKGGVGKTSIAAATGVQLARAGLKTLVILKRPGAYDGVFATGRALWQGLQERINKAGLPAQFDGLSVPQFLAGGGIVLACNLALSLDMVPKFKARDKSTGEAAHKAAVAALIPGVILQPSGVFAAIRAQQVGCTYVRAT